MGGKKKKKGKMGRMVSHNQKSPSLGRRLTSANPLPVLWRLAALALSPPPLLVEARAPTSLSRRLGRPHLHHLDDSFLLNSTAPFFKLRLLPSCHSPLFPLPRPPPYPPHPPPTACNNILPPPLAYMRNKTTANSVMSYICMWSPAFAALLISICPPLLLLL